jgi:hypothetical protein
VRFFPEESQALFMPIFTRVRGRGILGTSPVRSSPNFVVKHGFLRKNLVKSLLRFVANAAKIIVNSSPHGFLLCEGHVTRR